MRNLYENSDCLPKRDLGEFLNGAQVVEDEWFACKCVTFRRRNGMGTRSNCELTLRGVIGVVAVELSCDQSPGMPYAPEDRIWCVWGRLWQHRVLSPRTEVPIPHRRATENVHGDVN